MTGLYIGAGLGTIVLLGARDYMTGLEARPGL